MKKKLCLLLSCLVSISMFTWMPLPSEAAMCSHNLYYTDGVPIPTGVVFSHDQSTHTIEYGIEYICSNCGYQCFRDTYSLTENHKFSAELRLIRETAELYFTLLIVNTAPNMKYIIDGNRLSIQKEG